MNDLLKKVEEYTAYAEQYLELDGRDAPYVKKRLLEFCKP